MRWMLPLLLAGCTAAPGRPTTGTWVIPAAYRLRPHVAEPLRPLDLRLRLHRDSTFIPPPVEPDDWGPCAPCWEEPPPHLEPVDPAPFAPDWRRVF